jgi:hypothetical protein
MTSTEIMILLLNLDLVLKDKDGITDIINIWTNRSLHGCMVIADICYTLHGILYMLDVQVREKMILI